MRLPVRRLLAALTPAGIYVSTLPSAGRIAAALLRPLYSRKRVAIATVKPRGTDLEVLGSLCEEGRLKPVIEKRFALAHLAAAHEYSRAGRTAGKIAIIVAHDEAM